MILRTDLYAAILHQDRQSRKEKGGGDSTTRVLVGMFVFLLVAGAAHYFYLKERVSLLRPEADAASTRAAKIQKELQGAEQRIEIQREKVARRDALMQFAKNRLPWAPVIESVFETTPPYIEMTAIRGSSFLQKQNTLVISGQTATRNSRLDCDKFRLLLMEALGKLGINAEGKFTHLEETDSGAKTGNAFLTTVFEIQLTWNGQSHGR